MATPAEPQPALAIYERGREGPDFLGMSIKAAQRLVLVLLLLGFWQIAAYMGWINASLFPPPLKILSAIRELAQLGLLWHDVYTSVVRVTIGVAIAAAIAIVLAVLFSQFERLGKYSTPMIDVLRPISPIAWIPVAILWFGIGNQTAWFIIFLGAFFPIFTNVYAGLHATETIHIQAAQSLGADRWLFIRKVLIPSALPHILTGMRIGLGVGWMCVIAAEMIAATSGLGYMIQLARALIEPEKVLGGMLVIGVIGYLMNEGMLYLEAKLTGWR
jgi:ABC-type nitrate/sulfonate/bicarbonate transport system permease component